MFSLGRKVDINYPSNKWLIIITIIIALSMAFFYQSITNGLLIAFGFFLAWALTREIDPQNEKTAFLAGFIFIITTFFIFDGLQFALLFWLLLGLRFISKICGKTPSIFDVITLIMLSSYLTYNLETPIIISLTTLMFILAWFRYNKNYLFLLAGIITFLITILASVIISWQLSDLFNLIIENYNIIVMLSIILLLYFPIQMLTFNQTYQDDLGAALEYQWLQLSVVFLEISFISLILFVNLSFSTLLLLLVCLISVNLSTIYLIIKKKRN